MSQIINLADVLVIAPNFKKRLSGVTSTIIQLIPEQNRLGISIACLSSGLPKTLPHIRCLDLWRLWQKPKQANYRVWHARRNIEMLPAIILRDLLRMKIKILFTSASQREHTRYTKWLISKMDHVVATSAKTAKYLSVPNTVIYHGIDLERFKPHDNKAELKQELGLQTDKHIVGCFGRIRHQKGTDLFVDAMIKTLPQNPDWIAIIAGRTTLEHEGFEKELKQKIQKANLSDRIIFVGEHKDIERWYQALDLYIAPQRWEGFGLTPLEAGACAIPTIATDVGAFSELIINGHTGDVIDISDLEHMAHLANLYMTDEEKRKRASKAVRSHMEEHFSLTHEAEALNQIYKNLSEQT